MPDPGNIDPRQKEVNYYKKRVKELSSSLMGMEHERVRINKDMLQMSEGLKIISELQFIDSKIGDSFEALLDEITEIVNIRLKMDVTTVLWREGESFTFRPRFTKAYSGYMLEAAAENGIPIPEPFVRERQHLMVDEHSETSALTQEIRRGLGIPYFILYPIFDVDELLGYLVVGKREMILQKGSGLMPYHLNTVEAIAGVMVALRNHIERNQVLDRLVKKRTSQLAREKEKSDQLLLNILPFDISQELKRNGSTTPRDHSCVTVLFTDFKDFSRISEGLSSQELVSEIDFYYSRFDEIITRHGLEKIKTIGDAYMCAAGMPREDEAHALKAAAAAMDIREFTAHQCRIRKEEGRPFFNIRIGLHSGPVVAGIVGIKKFAYDIWGDTVNVAARMEANAKAGKVNISQTTYELIRDTFDCTYRGAIEAKNMGKINMYFIDGPKERPAV